MLMFRSFSLAALLGGLALAGCTSQVTQSSQYSGFLPNYGALSQVQTPTGKTVLRWVDPSFQMSNYAAINYQPVGFYPPPRPTEQINDQTLSELLRYTNAKLSSAMAARLPLVQTPGPRTLIFRGAITGVDATNQGLKVYEVVPFALVAAGASAATGHRDQNTELFLEGQFIDAATGKPVLQVVRKGFGKVLDNNQQQVTIDDLKGIIDDLAQDIVQFN